MSDDREATRRYFVEVWKKYQTGLVMQPMDSLIAGVIIQHTEYHDLLEDSNTAVEADFSVEEGESNPFLHMGLHISIQEQYSADRPAGFRSLYDRGLESVGDPHMLEHRIMECLGEVLWRAQRDQTMPDEQAYLEGVRRMIELM